MYWIPLVALLAHIAEEYAWFPRWASRHFGTTTRAWYAYSHVVIVSAAVVICMRASGDTSGVAWRAMATALQCALGANALFHIATSVRFREYSPGVITGTVVVLPTTVYLVVCVLRSQQLTVMQVLLALGLGALVNAGAVASLFLRMDFDWKLRRPGAPD